MLQVIVALFFLIGTFALGIIGGLIAPYAILTGALLQFSGILLFVMCVLLLFTAYGFMKGTPWGWWIGILVGGVSILSIAISDLLGFVFGLILIYYLTRPYVKRWFRV